MSLQPSADAWAVVALGEAKTYVANDSFMWASVLGLGEIHCVIPDMSSLQSWEALSILDRRGYASKSFLPWSLQPLARGNGERGRRATVQLR
jgi:hypothetical protein